MSTLLRKLAAALHGLSHVGQTCKVDNGLEILGFNHIATLSGISGDHLRSADPNFSSPPVPCLRGYPDRLAQPWREPKPGGGFRCRPSTMTSTRNPTSTKNRKSPPLPHWGRDRHDLYFNTSRISATIHVGIHTVLNIGNSSIKPMD